MLRYDYKNPMGKMVIEQTNMIDKEKRRFTITICEANCMAAFVHIGKDTEGKELRTGNTQETSSSPTARCSTTRL